MKCLTNYSRISLAVLGLAGFIVAANLSRGQAAERSISLNGLIDEMTRLSGMAEFPDPAYVCKQFSSYDRKAKSPTENWFANDDHSQFLRVEERDGRKEHVLMDTPGPGAIVRIWSANPAGMLRIYLDGADQPVIQAAMSDLLGGKYPGLPRPIAGEYSKGWNLYFPLPYAKHCKVTSDAGNFYYHINYRTYEAGTAVETFTLDLLQAARARVEKLATRLAAPRGTAEEMGGQAMDFDLEIPAGGTVQQAFDGPKAFTRAVVRLTSNDKETALRGIIVRIRFDDELTVESPLGDFFGTAPGLNPYLALPLGMTEEGEMYCNWFMPFKQSATIELVNTTSQAATLAGEISVADYAWTDASLHFHAKWRVQFDVPTRPMQDWNYLTAKGKGVFAGVAFAIDNPVRDWWGEGDEKIYVDGESFPSHFGTGTEDYYGYAWCWPGVFTHAYHNQPRCDGPGNYGRTSVNRFHIVDRIPFTKDFRFDMELWHWNANCKVNLAVVAYWYARPGATDGFKTLRTSELVLRPMSAYVVPRVTGALEGEDLKILRVTGTAEPQEWDNLSNGKHLWWHAGMKPGDTLVAAFSAPKAGAYRVIGHFMSAQDYGIHQLAINGQDAGKPIDFYSPDVKAMPEIDLGTHTLKTGANELSVKVIGANAKAEPAYMFGLDYLLLKPAN